MKPTMLQPGSPFRSWLRSRLPGVRRVLLAPSRLRRRRRWRRLHRDLSREDRAYLVEILLPAVADFADDEDVLFVGVEWYTAGYPDLFPRGNLITVDINPSVARHGGTRHHIADVRHLTTTFGRAAFAAIVCNGVLGHGVDHASDVGQAVFEMAECLRRGGVLVLGFNDVDWARPEGVARAIEATSLRPIPFAGMPADGAGPIGPLRHVYCAYERS